MVNELKDGVTPRLQNNAWFNDNIKPRVKKAAYIEADDGFHYQICLTTNKTGTRDTILVAKVAYSGFIKAIFSVDKEVARMMGEKLVEFATASDSESESAQ